MKKLFLVIILLSFLILPFKANAQEVLGVSTNPTEEEKSIALTMPSVVRILTTFCGTFELKGALAELEASEDDYEFCTGAKGSGFIISSNGYIATNGHVVSFSESDKLRTAFLSPKVIDLYVDIITQLDTIKTDKIYTQTDKDNLIELIYSDPNEWEKSVLDMISLYDKGLIALKNDPEQIFVQRSKSIFKIDDESRLTNVDEQYEAEVVAIDYEPYEVDEDGEITFNSSDVAILKIDATNLPTVKLGNIDSINVSSSVMVLGFPGKADSPITSEESQGDVTVTKGIVSAIKDEVGGERKLIQTDASIAHGNSGGPAIDRLGNVIGIATYVTISESGSGDEAGDINFLRDIKDLIELAESEDISLTQSDIDQQWKEGLELFWQFKFTKAIEKFDEVKSAYPDHLLVQSYIDRANLGIKNGEEVLTWRDRLAEYIPQENQNLAIGVLVGGCSLMLIVIIFMIFARISRKRKKRNNVEQYTNQIRHEDSMIGTAVAANPIVTEQQNTVQMNSTVVDNPSIQTQSNPVIPKVEDVVKSANSNAQPILMPTNEGEKSIDSNFDQSSNKPFSIPPVSQTHGPELKAHQESQEDVLVQAENFEIDKNKDLGEIDSNDQNILSSSDIDASDQTASNLSSKAILDDILAPVNEPETHEVLEPLAVSSELNQSPPAQVDLAEDNVANEIETSKNILDDILAPVDEFEPESEAHEEAVSQSPNLWSSDVQQGQGVDASIIDKPFEEPKTNSILDDILSPVDDLEPEPEPKAQDAGNQVIEVQDQVVQEPLSGSSQIPQSSVIQDTVIPAATIQADPVSTDVAQIVPLQSENIDQPINPVMPEPIKPVENQAAPDVSDLPDWLRPV